MKNVDDLIESATELDEQGRSKGEIADELNVSRETASWLVDRGRSGADRSRTPEDDRRYEGPQDIHVDWSAIGRDSTRLGHAGRAMAHLLGDDVGEVDLTVGIEKAGVPLATTVASQLETDLAAYAPRKHQWEEGDIETQEGGSFSRNFAGVRERDCFVVDDTITSGTTMTETVEAIRAEGGEPVACVVLVDKRGVDDIEGVPVYSLVQVIPVAGES